MVKRAFAIASSTVACIVLVGCGNAQPNNTTKSAPVQPKQTHQISDKQRYINEVKPLINQTYTVGGQWTKLQDYLTKGNNDMSDQEFDNKMNPIIDDATKLEDKIESLSVPSSMSTENQQFAQSVMDMDSALLDIKAAVDTGDDSKTADANQLILKYNQEFKAFQQSLGLD